MERPPAPPEAVLIRLAREAAGIRVADAAKRAGVSVARWSQIESGSEVRHGAVSAVTGRAGTIARMAAGVGVSPERMATEGRRPDAAEILREITRQQEDIRAMPPESPREPERRPVRAFARDDDEEGLKPYVEQVLRELYRATGLDFPPGQRVPELAELPAMEAVLTAMPGAQIFQAEWEALLWDSAAVTPEERYQTIAILRRKMAEPAGNPKVRRIGLRRVVTSA